MRYEGESNGFSISVWPRYSKIHSDEKDSVYCFIYKIRVINRSENEATLLGRHWIINDGNRNTQEIEGDGVVGEFPTLKPGDSYEYDSYCPLPTPTGNMRGTFYLRNEKDSSIFEVKVPIFFLRTDLDELGAVI